MNHNSQQVEAIIQKVTQFCETYIIVDKNNSPHFNENGINLIKSPDQHEIAEILYHAKSTLNFLSNENQQLQTELKNDKKSWKEKIFGKDNEVKKLEVEIKSFQSSLKKAEEERDQFREERNYFSILWEEQPALIKKSEEKRDKHATYDMTDSRPKGFIIAPKFSKIGKEFYGLCNTLFQYCQGDFKNNRSQGIAHIYSVLSTRIILELWDLIKQNKDLPINTTDSILSDLKITEQSEVIKLRTQIDSLVKKGHHILKDIANTEPQGELFLEDRGVQFDSEKHNVMPSCKEEGRIEKTVYPGYRELDIILSKPIVFTISAGN